MESILKIFAKNLRRHRKIAGLTQEDLAAKSGLHRTYIGGIEQERVNASLKNVEKIAHALNVSPALLLDDGSLPLQATAGNIPHEDPSAEHHYLAPPKNGKISFEEINAQPDDLTIAVLCELIAQGYSGAELSLQFKHAEKEIRAFLRARHK